MGKHEPNTFLQITPPQPARSSSSNNNKRHIGFSTKHAAYSITRIVRCSLSFTQIFMLVAWLLPLLLALLESLVWLMVFLKWATTKTLHIVYYCNWMPCVWRVYYNLCVSDTGYPNAECLLLCRARVYVGVLLASLCIGILRKNSNVCSPFVSLFFFSLSRLSFSIVSVSVSILPVGLINSFEKWVLDGW